MGETHTGVEQADNTGKGNGSGKTARRREKRSRVEIETKKKMIRGSRSVSKIATKKRKMIQIAEQVGEGDLGIVRIQGFLKKQGRELGYKVGQYAWIGKKKKQHHSKSSGEGGGRVYIYR